MRIIVCVKRDLLGCHFLNQLLPQLQGHQLHVWLSDKTRPQEQTLPALSEIAFIERTLPIKLLFPLIDQLPASVQASTELATFDGLARRHRIACESIDDVNSPAMLARMREFAPDLLISARFSYIFRAQALSIPRLGVLNIHPGELPRYAGLFAPMRMLMEGHDELASTLHWIDEGIDTGPIIAIHRQQIDRKRGLIGQIGELYCRAIPYLLAQIDRLSQETCRNSGQVQDRLLRCYRSLPNAKELSDFADSGIRFWLEDEYRCWLARFLPSGMTLDNFAWYQWLQQFTDRKHGSSHMPKPCEIVSS